MRQLLFLAVFVAVLPAVAAHLEGEAVVVDGYRMELGLDRDAPVAGQSVTMVVQLENATTGEPVTKQMVWVRIANEEGVLFSSTTLYASEEGPAVMTLMLPEAGSYDIRVGFRPDGKMRTADFSVDVEGKEKRETPTLAVAMLFLGVVVGFLMKKFTAG